MVQFLGAGSGWVQTDELKQYLHDHYANRTFIVRDFLSGNHLHYDSLGSAVKHAPAGDWTETGFVTVGSARIEHNQLVLKAQRLVALFTDRKFQLRPPWNSNKHVKKKMEIELSGTPSSQSIDSLLSRVFLNAQDSFVDLVPEYWRSCVSSGLAGKNANCLFAPEIIAIPGLVPTQGPQPKEIPILVSAEGIFHVGGGVSPPRPLYNPEPDFTQAARAMKYQGTVTIALFIDKEGRPTNIRILQPLGAGLDVKAIQAVQKWKFEPAHKSGQPVSVEIAVEVDFHLY